MPLLRGKPIADALLAHAAARIRGSGITPGLAVVLIGDDQGSEIYVRLKGEAAERLGMRFDLRRFTSETDLAGVEDTLDELNRDDRIHGIIVQLPLPAGWDTDALISRIDPRKDADGFHPATLKRYLAGNDTAIPVLPRAVQELILASGIETRGAHAVALVNSDLFGRVIGHMLEQLGCVVTVLGRDAASGERSLLTQAQVVIAVSGVPGLVRLDTLRPDAVVIDAGITRVGDTVLGDVAGDKDGYGGWVTPIPGGVGPLTIACLLTRVTEAALTSVAAPPAS